MDSTVKLGVAVILGMAVMAVSPKVLSQHKEYKELKAYDSQLRVKVNDSSAVYSDLTAQQDSLRQMIVEAGKEASLDCNAVAESLFSLKSCTVIVATGYSCGNDGTRTEVAVAETISDFAKFNSSVSEVEYSLHTDNVLLTLDELNNSGILIKSLSFAEDTGELVLSVPAVFGVFSINNDGYTLYSGVNATTTDMVSTENTATEEMDSFSNDGFTDEDLPEDAQGETEEVLED